MWQGFGVCDKGRGIWQGGYGDMWQWTGTCGRGRRHVAGGGGVWQRMGHDTRAEAYGKGSVFGHVARGGNGVRACEMR